MNQNISVGTDIIEVQRIQDSLERHGEKFLDKILTPEEKSYCLQFKKYAPHVAGRFAAKEAVAKALGSGFGEQLAFHDIIILNEPSGQPSIHLSPKAAALFAHPQLQVSISHCHSHAIAFAMAQW